MLQVAVITPYHEETSAVLRQCHKSVRDQSHPCVHIVVGDGKAKSFFDGDLRVLHVKLPRPNADYGNTPRYIGALLAESYGFDAIAYLDADNWFDPDHILTMVAAQRASGADLIACKRTFVDTQGRPLTIIEVNEERGLHVDTSCWLVTRRAFASSGYWLMPKPVAGQCDRIFLQRILRTGYKVRGVDVRTVNYRTRYLAHYLAAKIEPPPDAKLDDAVQETTKAYLETEEGAAWALATGFSLTDLRSIY